MGDRTLHLPLSFELTDGVRLLAAALLRLQSDGDERAARDYALVCAVRLWDDWGRQGVNWRPCLNRATGFLGGDGKEPVADGQGVAHEADIDWQAEPLALLIEQGCGWLGEPGDLMRALMACRVVRLDRRGEAESFECGLVLEGFAECNEHLLPGYRTLQERGGDVRARNRKVEEQMKGAADAARMADAAAVQEGLLLFEEPNVPEEDRRAALGLLYNIDVACGRDVRIKEYAENQALTKAALAIARSASPLDQRQVMAYLLEHAANPAVSKDPAVILRDWGTYLKHAQPA